MVHATPEKKMGGVAFAPPFHFPKMGAISLDFGVGVGYIGNGILGNCVDWQMLGRATLDPTYSTATEKGNQELQENPT